MAIAAVMHGATQISGYAAGRACTDTTTGPRLYAPIAAANIEIDEMLDPASGLYYYALSVGGAPFEPGGVSPEAHGFVAGQEIYVNNVTGYGLSGASGAWTIQTFTLMGGAFQILGVSGGSATTNGLAAPASCGAAPVANFSGTPTTIAQGSTVDFTDLSTNTPTTWTWVFTGGTDPGGQTIVQNPVGIIYPTVGNFDVQLTAANAHGSDVDLKSGYITVTAVTPPVANWTVSDQNPLQGTTVQFTDTSTNTPTSWLWTLPGGTPSTSTDQNPTVTYSSVGSFDVTLEASNAGGDDGVERSGYITVDAFPFPTASGDQDARYSTKFVDRDMTKLITQYDRNAFSSGSVPFRMKVRGPSNLRRRKTVYKVTKE